nr:hypothetical transcript [Hymenolepis microstoma]
MPVSPGGGDPHAIGSSCAYVVMLCRSQDSGGRLELHQLKVLPQALSELLRFGKEETALRGLRRAELVCISAIGVPQEPIEEKITFHIVSSSRPITISVYPEADLGVNAWGVAPFLFLRCHSLSAHRTPTLGSVAMFNRQAETFRPASTPPEDFQPLPYTVASVLQPPTLSYGNVNITLLRNHQLSPSPHPTPGRIINFVALFI